MAQPMDHTPKVNAFRSFCMQVVDQLCIEFEREVSQMTQDITMYRGELARCADLLAFQLGKEKDYHTMLDNIANNTNVLVGKAQEVGQKHSGHEPMKQQMHQMLEQMFEGGRGALADSFGSLDEHRMLAEKHLMSAAELQSGSQAIQKELDNIMQTLQVPPVSYRDAPVMMGPSSLQGMQGGRPPQGPGKPFTSFNPNAGPPMPGANLPNMPMSMSNPGSPYRSPGGGRGFNPGPGGPVGPRSPTGQMA
ncbi:unnamed protein product [Symbiodinium natans]|uniref:Uncharacterized protein n=1 Tax=Symbiodinium natans TaxID=878477 RepID=A0A812V2K9_9DINO|nr:unnamed protein product [Symbiodinium natans]